MSSPGNIGVVIALLATLGIGSITAAWIARLTAISGFRQAWINALRDDFAEWLKLQEVARFNYSARLVQIDAEEFERAGEYLAKAVEAQHDALMLRYRIMTRLNLSEPDHKAFLLKLTDVSGTAQSGPSDPKIIAAAVDAACTVFKREWEVTKWGYLAGTMTRTKAHWRFLFH